MSGNNSQANPWNNSGNGLRNVTSKSSDDGSGYRPSFEFFELLRALKKTLGNNERVAFWLGEDPQKLKQQLCPTAVDRPCDIDQRVFRMMDRAYEFEIEEPVTALLDYMLFRYGRAPSMSPEDFERLHKAARVMESMEDYFGDGYQKAQKEAAQKPRKAKAV